MLCENTIKNLQPHIKDNRIQTGMGNGSQIDGMITNFRQGSVREPDTSAGYGFEILYDENSYDNYLVKVKSDVEGCVKSIRELYASLKPEDQQPSINSLTSLVEANYQEERKILAMVGVFAILSILMTMMAIIALSSYHAQMQTKDIAIMKSFGCSRRKIFSDMALGFIWPVLAGALVTVPAAWLYIQHWLEGYPERIANSAWIYTAAVILVLVIVTVAISSQAAKLMYTDPASELKKE